MTRIAPLGRAIAFPERIPFVRPPTPDLARVTEILDESWQRGSLTNGALVASSNNERPTSWAYATSSRCRRARPD